MKILLAGSVGLHLLTLKAVVGNEDLIKYFLCEDINDVDIEMFEIIICLSQIEKVINQGYMGQIIFLNDFSLNIEYEKLYKRKNIHIVNELSDIGRLSLILKNVITSLLLNKWKDLQCPDQNRYLEQLDIEILDVLFKSESELMSVDQIIEKVDSDVDLNQLRDSINKIKKCKYIDGEIHIGVFGYQYIPND